MEKLYEKIDSLRKSESDYLLKFLGIVAFLTLFVLIVMVGFFGEQRAWQVYFIIDFVLVIWLAFRLLELEAQIEETTEKLEGKNI